MEYSTKIMSFSNEIDQQKWRKKITLKVQIYFHSLMTCYRMEAEYLNSHLNVNRAEFDNKRFR